MKYILVKAKVVGKCDGCCFVLENRGLIGKLCKRPKELISCMYVDRIITYDRIYAKNNTNLNKINIL